MRKELRAQYEKDLIVEIAMEAEGIGKTSAGYIAEYLGSLQDFLKATRPALNKMANKNGRRILTEEKTSALLDLIKAYSKISAFNVSEAWIYYLARKYLKSQIEALEATELEELDINPLLAKALHLKTPEDIVTFNLYQHVTRSAVTSWGSTVESMLKYSGCEVEKISGGRKGRRPDLKKIIGSTSYFFQIKSGPNTMNVDMIESLNEVIEEVEKSGATAFLGMTYGRRDRISPQIRGNLKEFEIKTKIGRELWDFISETKDYHKRILQVLDDATTEELRRSFTDLVEAKIIKFSQQWEFSHKGKEMNVALEEYI